MMRILSYILFMSFLTSCATQQVSTLPPSFPTEAPTQRATQPWKKAPVVIDVEGLQHYLGFDYRPDKLGYGEKHFNTCEMGFGYSRSEDCQVAYFVQINFQLLCRPSDKDVTTNFKVSDQRPLSGSVVKWKLEKSRGSVTLDGSGKGQLRFVSARSAKDERLKLTVGNDFVMQIAEEVDRILVPQGWCQ